MGCIGAAILLIAALVAAPAAAQETPPIPLPHTATDVAAPAVTPPGDGPGEARLPAYLVQTEVIPPVAPTAPRPQLHGDLTVDAPAADSGWYGWQTLLVTAASGSVVAAGFAKHDESLTLVGLIPLAVGPSLVHFAHGEGLAGLASLGLHLGGSTVGAATGAAIACSGGGCGTAVGVRDAALGAAVGALVAEFVATLIDATALAYESDVAISPTFAVADGQPALGFAGRF